MGRKRMTRDEAIETLEEMIEWGDSYEVDYDACKIAIEALRQEPCDDAISREAALDVIAETDVTNGTEPVFTGKQVQALIRDLPSVRPIRLRGRWIALENRFELGDRVKCSECGQVFVVGDDVSPNYCPNCGAQMDKHISGKENT